MAGNFKNRFLQASDNGIDYDCEFIVGSENITVKGHKLIFSVASDVFKAMFYGHLNENNAVKIEDLDADGFNGMKHFIYTGEVNFTSVFHALSTYIAARKYLISELTKECINYIQENTKPSEVLELYENCETLNMPTFEELCLKMIEEKTDEIVNSEYFATVKIETIHLILKSRRLRLKSEIEVFNLFEKWALAEAARKQISETDLATRFANLKKYVRFLTISSEEFNSRIEPSFLLTQAEKLAIKSNLLKPDTKPMPENLSDIQQRRSFSSKFTTCQEYKSCHRFVVSVDEVYRKMIMTESREIECSQNLIRSNYCLDYKVIVVESQDKKYICCTFQPQDYNSVHNVFKIQSKVSVFAKNECDDLTILNECKILFDRFEDSHNTGLLLADIPINELMNDRFFPGGIKRALIIQVQFNIIPC